MSSFCYSHFFRKKFQHICLSLNVNFNEPLTNDFVSFEQLGPGFPSSKCNDPEHGFLGLYVNSLPTKDDL